MIMMTSFIKKINNLEKKIIEFIYEQYIKDKCNLSFSEFKDSILVSGKKRLIPQDDILNAELQDIKMANKLYEEQKGVKKELTDYGYPDEYRCDYICNIKNNLSRCRNKISGTNSLYCCRHLDKDNIFWDKYQSLIKNLN